MIWFEVVRFLAGLLAFGIAFYLIFLTGSEEYHLTTPAMFFLFALVIALMYGTSELTDVIRAWKGA